VVELAEWGLVPCCGVVLAGLGADVIKTELLPRGDVMRHDKTTFEYYNRGKRGIALDFSQTADQDLFAALLKESDVLLTSFSEMRRSQMGLGSKVLRTANPRLIIASGSAAGSPKKGHGLVGFSSLAYWARGGIGAFLTGKSAHYVKQPAGFPDASVAMNLACGICAALYRRTVSGEGCDIDASMLGAAVWQMGLELASHGSKTPSTENPLGAAYRSADDRFIVLAMHDGDRQWPRLCAALGREDLLVDHRFATAEGRLCNAKALHETLLQTFRSRPLSDWSPRLTTQNCAWAPASSIEEILEDPLVVRNGFLDTIPFSPSTMAAAIPLTVDGNATAITTGAPRLGEHNAEVLGPFTRD
jgi:crotonobetainyl-CoA:carnitine CoA-transferase CaiB-like acyl-CoA transferase